jgi:hypothetical protein
MFKSIPIFPNFRPFTKEDISWYDDFYFNNNLNPYADLNPNNLFVWFNMVDDLSISKLNEAIIVKFTNVLDNNKLWIMPLAKSITNNDIELIFLYLKEYGLLEEIREIPSSCCSGLDDNRWSISDDRGGFEYILDTNQQYLLDGSDFSRQRRRVNYFEREHQADKIEVNFYNDCTEELESYFLHHLNHMPLNSNEESTRRNLWEANAVKRNLEYFSLFHKKAMVIKINGEVVSLSLLTCLDDKTIGVNHIKVDYGVQYIFQYTIYQLAKILREKNILEMNLEQDLDFEGLRIFKERLQPSRYLEKKVIKRL